MTHFEKSPIPAHVPADLVRDFDYMNAPEGVDLYDWWRSIQDGPDVFFTPRHGGHWVLTRHDEIAHVMATPTDFSSRVHTLPAEGKPLRMAPIEYDPPLHTDFRRLLAPFFTPKAIGNLEVRARDLAVSVIDSLKGRGECDFVADFSLTMPIGIFMSLVDLPDGDRLHLLDVAEAIVRGKTPEEQGAGFMQAFAYLGAKIAERRANPGTDMLSAIIHGKIEDGRKLTDNELLGMGALLLAGGLDTVAGMMGFMAHHLATHDDHRQALLDDPGLIPHAVEEMMRRYEIANVARVVTHDLVLNGVAMKEGDCILTATAVAGLDERQYPDAMTVDFARENKRSLVFGKGPHQCIGAYLARTELRVFLAEWLKRIPHFRVKPGAKPIMVSGRANSVHYLPLVWDI
ncbi:MAG: hypothetical protein RIS94_1877 [Pseudomonadota bacterium]|jgi:cytochrome P450